MDLQEANRREFLASLGAAGAAAVLAGSPGGSRAQAAEAIEKLAVDGGTPVRKSVLSTGPTGPQFYDDVEKNELLEVLASRSPFRKPGGKVSQFEQAYAAHIGAKFAFAVTSGGYQRYFTGPDGTVYQHILAPKTGWPVQGDLLSVTIVADNGTMADAYSTALYVMGREAAQDFWRQNGGFDMVLITKDGQVLYTPGLADKLTETEGSGYAYASIEP